MSFNLTGSDLPLVHTGLVKFTEQIGFSILRTRLNSDQFAPNFEEIDLSMQEVYDMPDRILDRYNSTIRLAQLDYRRDVERARALEPRKAARKLLINTHTAQYKLSCFYATTAYKNSMRLVYRSVAAVAAFKTEFCETPSA